MLNFNLPPDKAIKFFEAKGLKISWNWMDVWNQEHAKAFTVAKAMSYDILNDIKQATSLAIKDGLTKTQFRDSLEKTLKSKGWWGRQRINGKMVQLGSPWRLDTIYRNNLQSSYMAGRWQAHYANKDKRPYLKYIAVNDSVTRDSHRALNGKIYAIDNPIWRTIYPPNGFNCRCRTRALTESQARGKVSNSTNLPDGFPDNGFSHNVGLTNPLANKYYTSLNKLPVRQATPQLRRYTQELSNSGYYSKFVNESINQIKGNTISLGYIKDIGYLSITDSVMATSLLSIKDKENLALILLGSKEIFNNTITIKSGAKRISISYSKNGNELVINSIRYVL